MKNLDLQKWEKVLVTFASLLFLASFTAYVSEFPLRNYIFGLDPEQGLEEIGKVSESGGTLKREMLGQADFKVVARGDALFARDTVVTGEKANATIQLNDGSTIELGPRTMVKLENEGHSSLLGVMHTTRVNVVSGQVTGNASSATGSKTHVVIRTRDDEIDVTAAGAPKTVKVSAEKPFVPPARSIEAADDEEGLLDSLVNKLTGKSAKPQLISTDATPEKPTTPITPTPDPVRMNALEASPKPSLKPSPSPTPTPCPTPAPAPTPRPSRTPRPTPTPIAKPTPKPTAPQWTFQIVSPAQNTKLIPETSGQAIGKTIQLAWKVSLKNPIQKKRVTGAAALSIKLAQLGENGQIKKVLFEKAVTTAYEKTDALNYLISQPGTFEFQVSGGESSSKVRFSLQDTMNGIELIQPETIDFNKKEDLMNRGRRIAKVRLSWKPMPTANSYKLKLYDRSSGTEKVQELDVADTAYVVTRQSAAQREMHYEVSTKLPNGIIAHSSKEKFIFDFPPPAPTTPPSRSVITAQDMEAWEGGVLLTWQQTGVSEGYLIEVAQDAAFSKVLIKRSQKDNFFLLRPIKGIRHYWWRVSAQAHQLVSRASQVFEFTTKSAGTAKTSKDANQSMIQDQPQEDQEL